MDLVKVSNGMKTEVVRIGQKLRIWTGKFSVQVDKSQNVLMLKSGEDVLKVYNVSTGANNSTPVGTFKIVTKLEDPVWFKAGAVIPPESPENVLGTRWMGFDIQGYGIHGTVSPDKIGQQVTAGCIRMRNEEVEELYKVLPRGTEVTIVD
jgi:lipoprotein-anchoring transpeptidase ErfK/SrfK